MTGAEPVLSTLIASAGIRAEAVSYMQVVALVFPLLAIESVLAGYLTGLGRPRASVVIEFSVAGLNILLNALLIFGAGPIPALGAAGAAAGTVIAHALGALAALIYLRRVTWREETGHLTFASIRTATFALIARVSIPRAVQVISYVSFAAFLLMVERTQTSASAEATTLALRFMEIVACVAIAAGVAGGTLSGQALGAGDRRRAKAVGWRAIAVGGWGTTAAALLTIASLPLMKWAGIPTADASVWELLPMAMVIFSLTMCVEGFGNAGAGILQGAGLTGWVARWDLLTGYLVFLPLSFLLFIAGGAPLAIGLLAYVAYSVVYTIGVLVVFQRGRWRDTDLSADGSADPFDALRDDTAASPIDWHAHETLTATMGRVRAEHVMRINQQHAYHEARPARAVRRVVSDPAFAPFSPEPASSLDEDP
jgi:Na+-driven multidrug efflux pump